ncbi:uncharacterized protein E0L32_002606 [Thyridium curvatum]|uniref:F-box domain-containing protein n=1 Tax=Thyridium curvatum TaxID=1093900 RepID=A0A507BMM1_9PEZI|nr:uncharacterized protein E0L32_002606 [Thyridium curvatum]TPX18749.1 hypothetical protein E0L32_002606 [Thyridium curvatum]
MEVSAAAAAIALDALPSEVLSLILQNLIEIREDENELPDPSLYASLCESRLVCRKWNALATPHLFRTVSLKHDDPGNETGTLDMWREMMDSETVRQAVQHVNIHTAPRELSYGRYSDVWNDWEVKGEYEDYTESIERINELHHLKSLTLSFSDMCLGVENDRSMEEDYEVPETREATLKAFFKTLQKRSQAGDDLSAIRTLTISNLQNMPVPHITTSDAFRDSLKGVQSLHLMIAAEVNEHGPDHDIECVERWTYEPHLQHELLPSLTEQLTTLTLCFTEEWGVAPGYFDGRGLNFPQLKSMHLGRFMIGHHDHFDWILNMSSLTSLRLSSCRVVSHLRLCRDLAQKWELKTHDWEQQPRGAFGFAREDDRVYTFDKTWESLFDGIRLRLTKLVDFRMHYPRYSQVHFFHPDLMPVDKELSPDRYIVLDTGLLPSPWIDATNGEMEFGNNMAEPVDLNSTENHYIKKCKMSRAEETKYGDARALQDLLEAVKKRW